jgi:hypothetical protein
MLALSSATDTMIYRYEYGFVDFCLWVHSSFISIIVSRTGSQPVVYLYLYLYYIGTYCRIHT